MTAGRAGLERIGDVVVHAGRQLVAGRHHQVEANAPVVVEHRREERPGMGQKCHAARHQVERLVEAGHSQLAIQIHKAHPVAAADGDPRLGGEVRPAGSSAVVHRGPDRSTTRRWRPIGPGWRWPPASTVSSWSLETASTARSTGPAAASESKHSMPSTSSYRGLTGTIRPWNSASCQLAHRLVADRTGSLAGADRLRPIGLRASATDRLSTIVSRVRRWHPAGSPGSGRPQRHLATDRPDGTSPPTTHYPSALCPGPASLKNVAARFSRPPPESSPSGACARRGFPTWPARIGASPALILYYFPSKDALLAEALAFRDQLFFDGVEQGMEEGAGAAARLGQLIEASCPPSEPLDRPDNEWLLWLDVWTRSRHDRRAVGRAGPTRRPR